MCVSFAHMGIYFLCTGYLHSGFYIDRGRFKGATSKYKLTHSKTRLFLCFRQL